MWRFDDPMYQWTFNQDGATCLPPGDGSVSRWDELKLSDRGVQPNGTHGFNFPMPHTQQFFNSMGREPTPDTKGGNGNENSLPRRGSPYVQCVRLGA